MLAKHEGKYIAIINDQVPDVDSDFGVLARRMYAKYGYRHLLIRKVEREPGVFKVPSPRR